jgi:hypothetical protein
MDKIELLRMMEIYIQSVSESPAIPDPSNTHRETRISRRTARYQQDYSNNKGNDQSQPSSTNASYEPNVPYVPNRVWYNSTWEDWAQLDVGDILHYPFSEDEIETIKFYVAKQSIKKSARHKIESIDFWQYISTFLPGRTPLDCRCFWTDYTDSHYKLFNKVIIIRREKGNFKHKVRVPYD